MGEQLSPMSVLTAWIQNYNCIFLKHPALQHYPFTVRQKKKKVQSFFLRVPCVFKAELYIWKGISCQLLNQQHAILQQLPMETVDIFSVPLPSFRRSWKQCMVYKCFVCVGFWRVREEVLHP